MKKRKNKKDLNNGFNILGKIISVFFAISVLVGVFFVIYFDLLPLGFLSLFIIVGGIVTIGLIILINSKLKKWIRIIFMILGIFFLFY